ncbi:MAG: DUF4919 domain-containing protein [Candidatus Kapabacteria bacterium]|jgi:hypothetical protein|nr:DUF4919 domain-containing protein [Candidatus Kapabacteria bacterium]
MRLSVFYILLLVLGTCTVYSQHYEAVDIKQIKEEITNKDSKFYYPNLYERYANNDTSLSITDYRYLYYGHSLQAYFNPNIIHTDDSVKALRKLTRAENSDPVRVAQLAEFVLRLDPFSLEAIFSAGVAYEVLGDSAKSGIYIDRYFKIIKAILESGSGKTTDSALVVNSISDEYSVIYALGLKPLSQGLIEENGKNYDLIQVDEDNKLGLKSVYFDVELFIHFNSSNTR